MELDYKEQFCKNYEEVFKPIIINNYFQKDFKFSKKENLIKGETILKDYDTFYDLYINKETKSPNIIYSNQKIIYFKDINTFENFNTIKNFQNEEIQNISEIKHLYINKREFVLIVCYKKDPIIITSIMELTDNLNQIIFSYLFTCINDGVNYLKSLIAYSNNKFYMVSFFENRIYIFNIFTKQIVIKINHIEGINSNSKFFKGNKKLNIKDFLFVATDKGGFIYDIKKFQTFKKYLFGSICFVTFGQLLNNYCLIINIHCKDIIIIDYITNDIILELNNYHPAFDFLLWNNYQIITCCFCYSTPINDVYDLIDGKVFNEDIFRECYYHLCSRIYQINLKKYGKCILFVPHLTFGYKAEICLIIDKNIK